ncbi:hypothetical protein TURU_002299 [Turdus rufiventris]|nr:hypothetical protein TURU_002299 [Turdus rufiventris]
MQREREDGGMGKCPTSQDPDRTKVAGEGKLWDLGAGKEDQELGPAWLGQETNSKGRDESHSSREKLDLELPEELKDLSERDNMESWNALGWKRP